VEWNGDPTPPIPPAAPAAPTGLQAAVSLGSPIALSWTDNSADEETFEIERRTGSDAFAPLVEFGPNTTSFADLATQPGQEYSYRVRAANAGGRSAYSNEASATSSILVPAPKAPVGLAAIRTGPDVVELFWYDVSPDETSFEVHRRNPLGEFSPVASTPPNTGTFTDTDLPPDTPFVYGVRSVGVVRASAFTEVAVSTLPTLSVTATRADLKDSPKFGKDSLKVQALFDFLPESPDGLFDVIAEGITLRAGPVDRPIVMHLPKNLDTWKVRGTRATWKSAKGSTPKYSIQVDAGKRTVKATASGLELPEPPANPMRVSIAVGDDAGTARGDWEMKKAGVFQLR
jgi:hypothetical protein